MLSFLMTFALVLLAWVALTFTLGTESLLAGVIVSLIVAGITRSFIFHEKPGKLLNPRRWFGFLSYLGLFMVMELRAHLDVACRVITGRINPAIVKMDAGLRTDIGKTMLANTITLTPGTLVVRAEDGLYVHWISNESKKKGMETLRRFVGRVTE